MPTTPIAASLLFVPVIVSKHEQSILYEMLTKAIAVDDELYYDTMRNVIIVVIDYRFEGLIEYLAECEVWDIEQVAVGEIALAKIVEISRSHVESMLLMDVVVDPEVAFRNLGVVMTYLWQMYDDAYDSIRDTVAETTGIQKVNKNSDPRRTDMA
jgi:hypothetical protein